jgi:hypothetical protein
MENVILKYLYVLCVTLFLYIYTGGIFPRAWCQFYSSKYSETCLEIKLSRNRKHLVYLKVHYCKPQLENFKVIYISIHSMLFILITRSYNRQWLLELGFL